MAVGGVPKSTISIGDALKQKLLILQRNRSTLMIYISLFTSILALFILIISLIELETSTPKRNFQKIVNFLEQDMNHVKYKNELDWLNIENTFSKGVKLTMSPDYFVLTNLFNPARAKINPYYLPFLRQMGEFIREVELESFPRRYSKLVQQIEASGYDFLITVRIEGYTDATPLAKTALYRNNLQLSTFRAYAMMDLLKRFTGLPESYFSIAGYGDSRPIVDDPKSAINRRVEIYLIPQLIEKGTLYFEEAVVEQTLPEEVEL